jgi:N-acetylglucosaminyldiphosphoundecaprenol N-acetyl-beta-D-mannosaminyltransferase
MNSTIPRVNVLGVGISVLNLRSATRVIAEAIENRQKGYICVTGVHGVMEAQSDRAFRDVLNRSFLNTPDGMPMVWMGKFYGYGSTMDRVYGPDLMLEVCEWSRSKACTHFLLGGAPGVAEQLRHSVETRFPGIRIVGCYSPPFRPLNRDEEFALQEDFDRLKPDLTWVGLSTPKQEKFIADYLPKLNTTIMIGVGAAFDFHSGRVRQAPRWIQRSGFEWFFRMCHEPKRLWWRYCKNNPRFVLRLLCQITGLKKYPLA